MESAIRRPWGRCAWTWPTASTRRLLMVCRALINSCFLGAPRVTCKASATFSFSSRLGRLSDMRRKMYLAFLAAFVLPPMWGVAAVIDRVALVINNKVITEGEVLDELRVTEFLNNEPLDLGPTARRAAGDRLVDQELLRNEMNLTGYAQPPAADADTLLKNFRDQHYPS